MSSGERREFVHTALALAVRESQGVGIGGRTSIELVGREARKLRRDQSTGSKERCSSLIVRQEQEERR